MLIAGVDTGANTACVITDERGVVSYADVAKLGKEPILRRYRLIRGLFTKAWSAGARAVYIEDISKYHSATKGATSHSIASVQRDFAMTVALAVEIWAQGDPKAESVVMVPVSKWYPRIHGTTCKKKQMLAFVDQQAKSADPVGGKLIKNEHLRVGWALSQHGHRDYLYHRKVRQALRQV